MQIKRMDQINLPQNNIWLRVLVYTVTKLRVTINLTSKGTIVFFFLSPLSRGSGVSEFVLPSAPSNPIDAILFAKKCGCTRSFMLSHYRHVFCCAHVRIPNPIGHTISMVQLRVCTVFTKLQLLPLFYVTTSSFLSCSCMIIRCSQNSPICFRPSRPIFFWLFQLQKNKLKWLLLLTINIVFQNSKISFFRCGKNVIISKEMIDLSLI